ncbi:MAG: class I SAM-dependent methyltransferase [Candidatus Diapherotrites archaeon]
MRRAEIEKYEQLYGLGVKDRVHSLQKYDLFLHNVLPELAMEKLVKARLKTDPLVCIMDIGCGEGNALKELKQKFKDSVHVTGVDLVRPEKLEGLDEFIRGDALNERLPEKQDIIVSFRALHEIGHVEEMGKKIARCLGEGGVAVLSIRLQECCHGSLICIGDLTKDEVNFVVQLAHQHEWEHCKVTVYGTMLPYEHGRYLAGATIVLEKE